MFSAPPETTGHFQHLRLPLQKHGPQSRKTKGTHTLEIQSTTPMSSVRNAVGASYDLTPGVDTQPRPVVYTNEGSAPAASERITVGVMLLYNHLFQ